MSTFARKFGRLIMGAICIGTIIFISISNAYGQSSKDKNSLINRSVDSSFIYAYEKKKYVPPQGSALLIMGQTVQSITEYMDRYADRPMPSGWAAYWGIPEFKGVKEAHSVSSGNTQNHQMIIDEFPNTVLQSAMWMVGKWEVAEKASLGMYDKVVKKYASWAKKVDRPIYLRIGYEFDGVHNELDPITYKKAYKHIVNVLREEGADNIAFVWHSYAGTPYQGHPVSAWYPGDDYVDWVGISVFGHAYSKDGFGADCDAVLSFAKEHKKPVMIAESNPIHGISADNEDVWEQWYVNYFNFIHEKNIKAISFINEDWPRTGIGGISDWKDSRLYNNEKIADAWFQEVSRERYLKQSPELYDLLGYKKK